MIRDGQQQAGGCSAIVGADKVDIPQPVIGLIVRGQHDCAGFLAWKAHDEVAHGHRADGGVGCEGVLFDLVVLEVVAQEGLGLQVALAGGPARADGDELAGVFEGFSAVEVGLGGSGEWNDQEYSRRYLLPK